MSRRDGLGLACAFIDQKGELADGLEALGPELRSLFDHVGLSINDATHPNTRRVVEAMGAHVRVAPRAYENVGRERRLAVRLARTAGARAVVAGDLDHILRWLLAAPHEVHEALDRAADLDCLVVGRPPGAFAGFPMALRATERLVNIAYERLTGHRWDLLSSVRVLSAAGADAVVDRSTVDTIATDVDWPLVCTAAGLRVGYYEAPHLTYVEGNGLAPPDSGAAEPDPGDARAWITRLRICGWMADALEAYT